MSDVPTPDPAGPAPLEEIRIARAKGDLLGDLVARYGAQAVVEALGVQGVAHILGLDEPLEMDDDYAD